jgi:hypothetical protein
MTFIDLAGSERLALIGFDESLYEEALFINESLRCLERVIRQLSVNGLKYNVDYEGNILTQLLKNSIGGDAKTLMIVNIAPSNFDLEATMDTLRFAERTGKIRGSIGRIPMQAKMTEEFLAYKMVKSITPSPEFVCVKPSWKIEGKNKHPLADVLHKMTLKELMEYRPVKVNFCNWLVESFGFTYSNGEIWEGSRGKHDKQKDLPDNISKIQIVFSKEESYIRYLRFFGDETLQIPETGDDFRGGRVETFEIDLEKGERFLGAEISIGDRHSMGVTWFKWKHPEKIPSSKDEIPEDPMAKFIEKF